MTQTESQTATCWWCQQRPATTGEHKFKRSDLTREHGGGELLGPQELVHYGSDRTRYLKSTKSKPLKFRDSLCAYCNNTRSQPHDYAYDGFIDWLFAHEDAVLDGRAIDLVEIFGSDWEAQGLNVLRYWGKHIGCRLMENDPEHFYARLPAGLIPFLDGGRFPDAFAFELWVEPAWLRFSDFGADDPLWVRSMSYDDLLGPAEPDQEGSTESVWRYSWLAVGWAFGGKRETRNPFTEPRVELPYRAHLPASFEWVWGSLPHIDADLSEADSQAHLEALTGGGPVDPEDTLNRSPIAEAFTGGVLDFEAAARGRAPDQRDVPRGEADISQELWRAALAVQLALTVWGFGDVDVTRVRAMQVPDAMSSTEIRRVSRALKRHARRARGYPAQASQLAQAAGSKMVEGMTLGLNPAGSQRAHEGQEALREAASMAGASAAAAGLAAGDLSALWDSVFAAQARMARFE